MAISSIHIATGKDGYFAHNSREKETSNSIFNDEKNYCSCNQKEAFEIYKDELKKRAKAYQERTNQKLQSRAITHLSAIVNLNHNHTEQDLKKVCDFLKEKLDTKILQYSIHRDEGHITEDNQQIKNYHAHIEFIGLNSKGNSIKRTLHKKELIEIQTEVAKLLNMQRGKNYTQEKLKRVKRLDTYEYKAHKEAETSQILAKQQDLRQIIKGQREKLKTANATREEYAKLESLSKELKEQVKNKDLTLEELNLKFKSYKDTHENKGLFKTFLESNKTKKELKQIIKQKDTTIEDIQNKNQSLDYLLTSLEQKLEQEKKDRQTQFERSQELKQELETTEAFNTDLRQALNQKTRENTSLTKQLTQFEQIQASKETLLANYKKQSAILERIQQKYKVLLEIIERYIPIEKLKFQLPFVREDIEKNQKLMKQEKSKSEGYER